uniref:Rubredoxin-like domain-containing protein n=1 Tax=Pyrodinium bahamense TaxID=73915 RepID=A0A7S0AH55_9DINO
MARPRAPVALLAALLLGLLAGAPAAFSAVWASRAPARGASASAARGGAVHVGTARAAPGGRPALLLSAGAMAGLGRGQRSALRAKNYWEGEWICADCGYIYNERAFGQKFEDLQAGFKCPNCAAPRRRFARKLGDKIGTTLDGGDTPILIFSAVALVVVLGIAYYALQ